MSKYNYNKDYFEKIDCEEKAYWLGFLYADGCITRFYKNEKLKSMSLELTLCKDDYNHLEKFKNALCANVPIQNKRNKLNGKYYESNRIVINCTKMCYDLINLGCTPNKTYDIKFPTFDIVPKIYMRDFIRGYFDGDGCISAKIEDDKKHIELVITGMQHMLKSIVDYLISEKIVRRMPKIYKDTRSLASSVYFYGDDSNKDILDYFYCDSIVFLDRKYDKYINYYKDYKSIDKRGVYWNEANKTYIVTIYENNKRKYIGRSKNLEEAINMRKEAEITKMKNSLLNQ